MRKFILLVFIVLFGACSSSKKASVLGYNDAVQQNEKALSTAELRQDARFLVDAKSYMILLGQMSLLAKEEAYSRAVQDFATKIQQDHVKVNTQLQQLATNEKIVLPQQMSESHQSMMQELQNTSRRDFDRVFIRTVERIYEDVLDIYREVATRGYNDEVRAFAARNLTLLKNHQQEADELEDELI